jgi:hypothetical protein
LRWSAPCFLTVLHRLFMSGSDRAADRCRLLYILGVGSCPSGYRDSGGYCAPTSGRAPAAVPKVG